MYDHRHGPDSLAQSVDDCGQRRAPVPKPEIRLQLDRARVAHLLADVYVACGDSLAAREALLLALSSGDRSQRDHARARLHAVCRDLGDQLGSRRWRSFERPALVSMSVRPGAPHPESAAPLVIRWRERMARLSQRRS